MSKLFRRPLKASLSNASAESVKLASLLRRSLLRERSLSLQPVLKTGSQRNPRPWASLTQASHRLLKRASLLLLGNRKPSQKPSRNGLLNPKLSRLASQLPKLSRPRFQRFSFFHEAKTWGRRLVPFRGWGEWQGGAEMSKTNAFCKEKGGGLLQTT